MVGDAGDDDGAGTGDTAPVQSVARAMTLLRLVSERGSIGVSEAARELGVAASTTQRLLATMAGHGAVVRTAGRRYAPGPLLLAAHGTPSAAELTERYRPAMQRLYAEVGETVLLMMRLGPDTLFIDTIEGTQALHVGSRIGVRIPAHCTSGGKAILASLGDEEIRRLYPDGLPPWPGARLHTVHELLNELAGVRERGYALNAGESERGIRAVGASVGPPGTPAHAAITVSVPAQRFDDEMQRLLPAALARVRAELVE